MRALCFLFLLALPVLARGGRKPQFEVPKEAPSTADQDREEEDKALRNTLRRLAGWPSERSRRAAERLIVQKERSLPLVLDVLASGDSRVESLKPGAAYVVGHVGDRSHFLTLLLVAAERPQHRFASVFLEAAWRLNPDAAVEEAFRFFHLSDTTLRREATKFVRDRIGKRNLPAIYDLVDRQKAERSFTREIGLTLLDRLVETHQVKWAEVGPHFYRALGDESPQVANRAMRLLASHNDPENLAALNQLITKEFSYWRQRSYAALSLGLLSMAYKLQPFTPEAIEILKSERGLGHPKELLAQASAALALAQAALRTGDKELVRLLDGRIPIVLIEAVGASNRHYRDFATVMPLAYTGLRRITGENLPDHAPRWAQWWRDHGRNFRARRELLELEEEDLGSTIADISWPVALGERHYRFSVASTSRPTYLRGRAFALTGKDMARLIQALREAGFFQRPEADPGRVADSEALVVVRVGDLARTIAFTQDVEGENVRERILGEVDTLVREYGWQLWRDLESQPSWELFFGENRRWFADHEDPKERAARLRAMVAASLDDLVAAEDRLDAARFVAQLPEGGGALEEAEVAAFLEAVAVEPEANDFAAAVLDLLVPAAGAAAAEGMVAALGAKVGPRAHLLLVKLCRRVGSDRIPKLAADPRWKVRRAAVAALAESDPELARPILAQRLTDEEALVRVAAAEALARFQDVSALPALAELAADSSSEVRGAAAYAYGLLGTKEGLSAARALLYADPAPEVRTRAIDGLVEGARPGAARLLVGVFASEIDVRVRAAAARGVVELETPELVNDLMARLEHTLASSPERVALVNVLARFDSEIPTNLLRAVLQGDDIVSADAAALGLARRWDDSSISQLVRMLESGRSARAAIRHLQILTSQAFEAESFRRQAENYKGWFQTNSTGSPLAWFGDALAERGYEILVLRLDDPGEGKYVPPESAVPLLLRTLRDEDWYIRRNASFLLRRRIGPGSPDVITHLSTPAEEEVIIRAFNDWWARERRKKVDEERG